MSAAKRRRRRRGIIPTLFTILLVILLYFAYPYIMEYLDPSEPAPQPPAVIPVGEGEYIELHMIDIGQGDSILIRTAEGNVLIDAGPGKSEDELKAYLTSLSITEFEYAVFTHMDEDHIGGADMIMTDYTVSNVIMPDADADTKTYLKMMEAIDTSGATVIKTDSGDEYTLGSMTLTVLSPVEGKKYNNKNNYSVVMRLDFGETSIMLTGDAEEQVEEQLLEMYGTEMLDCDILKVGHHGSDSSSTPEFLAAVTPEFALISCGEGNSYGHPHAITVTSLTNVGADIYRTDELGSIILTTDGELIKIVGTNANGATGESEKVN